MITTGDLTRLMEAEADVFAVPVRRVMTTTPKSASAGDLAGAAVHVREKHGVVALPVLDDDGHVVGVVHLHDLMRAGAV